MVARVYDHAIEVDLLDEGIVATDDSRIEQACADLDIATMMTSSDHGTGTDRLAEVAERIPADLYVNIQGDEPMIEPDTIAAAIRPFVDNTDPGFTVTNLMTAIRRVSDLIDSTVPKVVVNDNSDAVFLSRSPIPYPKDGQDLTFFKQICVYAFRPDALARFRELAQGPSERAEGIELLRFLEHGIAVRMVAVAQDTVAVDTPSDLQTVCRLLSGEVSDTEQRNR